MTKSSIDCRAFISHMYLVIFFTLSFPIKGSGQSESHLESHSLLFIADKDVPDLLVQLGAKEMFNGPQLKSLEIMFGLKHASILRRMEITQVLLEQAKIQAEEKRDQARTIRAKAHVVLQELGKEIVKSESLNGQADASDFSPPISREVAEEMLRIAQLEQQRLKWDLAAEAELVKTRTSSHRSTDDATKAEIGIAKLAIEEAAERKKSLDGEYNTAKYELQQKGVISAREVQSVESQVRSAAIALRAAEARLQLIEAKALATENQAVATAKEELVRLMARKKSVDENIRSLQKLLPAFREFESHIRTAQQLDADADVSLNRCSELTFQTHELKQLAKLIRDTIDAKNKQP